MTHILTSPDLARLTAAADTADESPDWPAGSWDVLRTAGVLRWAIPPVDGGAGLTPADQLTGHEQLAAACLTTAFVLSQREAAVRLIARYAPPPARHVLLAALAAGGGYVTVGISQLTTSRQHRPPALVATPAGNGFRLDGSMPWVTGADRAEFVVTAAALPDGRQILLRLPPDRPGVAVGPPFPLVALRGSRTAAVRCDGVAVGPDLVVAGPAEGLLGPGSGGGPETSALALGLATAAVDYLRGEAAARPTLAPPADRLAAGLAAARDELHRLAGGPPDPPAAAAVRVRCTRLSLRATQAALTAAKGAGFVTPHPAGRWARQALFFLVWSCPPATAEALLDDLTADLHGA